MVLTSKRMNQIISGVLIVVFSLSFICPPDIARAQVLPPLPGEMLSVTSGFVPVMIKGMTPDPVNPLGFDFIIDTGHTGMEGEALKAEAQKLIKYFLVSLTVPEEDLWVNLSPYEKDRMIPADFGSTEMGRDLLAQDYILKQLTASLMYPERELGQDFWKNIYSKVEERIGAEEVPLNSFHKVWIVPDEAVVYEHKGTVYVVKSHLKVMLEEDYLALQKALGETASSVASPQAAEGQGAAFTQALKDVLIPEIEREVNEGEHFANLRQVYNSMILAAWYKANLRQTLLGQVYVDQAKVKGIDLKDPAVNQKIYERYVEVFKKGAYDYIKEEVDETNGTIVPRRYFSGGTSASGLFKAFAGEQAPGMKVEVIKDGANGLPATNAAVLRESLKEQGATFKVPMQLVENADDSMAGSTEVNSAIITKISVPVLKDPVTGKEQPIVFGTSGNRGKIASGFHHINVPRDAYAAAKYTLTAEPGKAMLVGFDPREGNHTSAKLVASINAAQGVRTIIINEPTATPVLAVIAQSDESIGGVVNLTASHNPFEDGGFKYSPPHGGAAPIAVTRELEKIANSIEEIPVMEYEAAKERGLIIEMAAEDAVRIYVHEYLVPGLKKVGAWSDIVSYIQANPDFHVYEDPMQGTMVKYARALLEELAEDAGRPFFTMIHENNMDSKFSEVDGQPRPEAPTSHQMIKDLVAGFQGKAFGLMQDGDADRFGNIDFDSAFIGANDTMALIAYFLTKDIGLKGQIGKSVATSNMINAIAAFLNAGEVDEEAVGFKWFVEKIVNQGRQYLIAGEESAHIGIRPFMKSWDDGLVIGLMSLWIVTRTGMSLREYKEKVLEALNMRFQIKSETLRGKNDSVKLETNKKIAQAKEELALGKTRDELSIVKEMNRRLADAGVDDRVVDVITKDGVKLVLNTGWILLRPSGTEPAVKAYAEAFGKFSDSQQVMQQKYDQLKKVVLLMTGVTQEQLEDKAKMELGAEWVSVLPSGTPATNAAVMPPAAVELRDWMMSTFNEKFVTGVSNQQEPLSVSTDKFQRMLKEYRLEASRQIKAQIQASEGLTLSEQQTVELADKLARELFLFGSKYEIRSIAVERMIDSVLAEVFFGPDVFVETYPPILDYSVETLKTWIVSNVDRKVVFQLDRSDERFRERLRQEELQFREGFHRKLKAWIKSSGGLSRLSPGQKEKLVENLTKTVSFLLTQEEDKNTYVLRSFAPLRWVENVIDEFLENEVVIVNSSVLPDSNPVGGIDLNSVNLKLQIKRDGEGIPLPLPQQPIGDMEIDGFYPVIINVLPIQGIPALLGMDTRDSDEGAQKQSAELMLPADKTAPLMADLDYPDPGKS